MTIKFSTNVPVEVHMRSIEGKPVESQFGGTQHMFSAEEGAFYVSEVVGQILTEQLRKLGVRPGQAVEITKAEVSRGNGRKGIQWIVTAAGGNDGTLKVPKAPEPDPLHDLRDLEQKLAASIAQVEARKTPQQAQQAQTAAAPPAWADALATQTCILVDAFASVVKHAARYEGLIKNEDVKSIFLSAFINMTKPAANGGNRNAA